MCKILKLLFFILVATGALALVAATSGVFAATTDAESVTLVKTDTGLSAAIAEDLKTNDSVEVPVTASIQGEKIEKTRAIVCNNEEINKENGKVESQEETVKKIAKKKAKLVPARANLWAIRTAELDDDLVHKKKAQLVNVDMVKFDTEKIFQVMLIAEFVPGPSWAICCVVDNEKPAKSMGFLQAKKDSCRTYILVSDIGTVEVKQILKVPISTRIEMAECLALKNEMKSTRLLSVLNAALTQAPNNHEAVCEKIT